MGARNRPRAGRSAQTRCPARARRSRARSATCRRPTSAISRCVGGEGAVRGAGWRGVRRRPRLGSRRGLPPRPLLPSDAPQIVGRPALALALPARRALCRRPAPLPPAPRLPPLGRQYPCLLRSSRGSCNLGRHRRLARRPQIAPPPNLRVGCHLARLGLPPRPLCCRPAPHPAPGARVRAVVGGAASVFRARVDVRPGRGARAAMGRGGGCRWRRALGGRVAF